MNTTTEVRAEDVATGLLRRGRTVAQVVEATGLEPREVMQLAERAGLLRNGQAATRNDSQGLRVEQQLAGAAAQLQRLADHDDVPARARARLRTAVAQITAAVEVVRDDAGRAALRKRLAELDRERQRLKAELRGEQAARRPTRDLAAVRTWAAEVGLACPDRGRIPRRVQDAYDQAHS